MPDTTTPAQGGRVEELAGDLDANCSPVGQQTQAIRALLAAYGPDLAGEWLPASRTHVSTTYAYGSRDLARLAARVVVDRGAHLAHDMVSAAARLSAADLARLRVEIGIAGGDVYAWSDAVASRPADPAQALRDAVAAVLIARDLGADPQCLRTAVMVAAGGRP